MSNLRSAMSVRAMTGTAGVLLAIGLALLGGASSAWALATPTLIVTNVNYGWPSTDVGEEINAMAVLSEGSDPTGTITFELYPATDATCSGVPVSTSSVAVTGNGEYWANPTESDLLRLSGSEVGNYIVVATYSGDGSNAAARSTCGGAIVSLLARPALTTTASDPTPVGSAVGMTAELSGGFNPTGTITFVVYGQNDPNCEEAPVFKTTVPLVGDRAASQQFVPVVTGTYPLEVIYNGDGQNFAALSGCALESKAIDVGAALPGIDLAASPGVSVGGAIAATAKLTSAFAPTGMITFTLFNPADSSCLGAPAATVTTTVANEGAASGQFATNAVGAYNFVAAYSGDVNNAPARTPCGSASVKIGLDHPTIRTVASASAKEGGEIADLATLQGAFDPTGTITFTVFGPDDPGCHRAPAFQVFAPVVGGVSTTGLLTATSPGTYAFVTAYSGDEDNAPAQTACGVDLARIPAPHRSQYLTVLRITPARSALLIRLRCERRGRQLCRGAVRLTAGERLHAGRVVGISAASRGVQALRTVTVGDGGYAVGAGRTAAIAVPLNRIGRHLRSEFKVLPLRLTLTATTPRGPTTTVLVRHLTLGAGRVHGLH
jgi:hypothetical protein